MNDQAPIATRYQVTVGGVFLIVAAIALVLWLGRYWADDDGVFCAIVVCAFPFALIVEFAFVQRRFETRLPLKSQLLRFGGLLLFAAIPLTTFYLATLEPSWYDPSTTISSYLSGPSAASIISKLELPMPEPVESYPCAGSEQISLLTTYYAVYVTYAAYVIPTAAFLFLCLPVIRNRTNDYLRIRSLALLVIFTLTSAYWFVSYSQLELKPDAYPLDSIVINACAIVGLWGFWFWQRHSLNTTKAILWNLAFVAWLFVFSHPLLGEPW